MASTSTLVGIVHLLILCTYVSATGFTTDLIPHDSPLSPFYNPSSTHYDRLQSALKRSLNRISHFNSKMEAPITPGHQGEYLMRVSLGAPPFELLGIADTGSDLTWTQCVPCTQCFKQALPLFDPHRSSSYKNVSCHSDSCNEAPTHGCSKENTNNCVYAVPYADYSFTSGDLATETFTIGGGSNENSSLVPDIVFGCGHYSSGHFENSTNGLVGLGAGNISFVSQLGVNGKKFSYCLTPKGNNSTSSKISFGSDAVVSGSGFVTTPIVKKSGKKSFYYLTLEAFSVGSQRIAFAHKDETRDDNDVAADEGNIIIDSGTTYTFLPSSVLNDFISALEEAISLPKVNDPKGQHKLCYTIDGNNNEVDDDIIKLPISVTAHFKGADVLLQPFNIFTLVADDMICLTMLPSDFAIFGNMAQMNVLVGYDLNAHVVSFKPTDCTNHQ